jgi:glycosyltransferase involved in cell wall biosynthesis
MPTVSVVIPTYKASAFIEQTLQSVFAQTRSADEVIVVDDCSPDHTLTVVEQVAATAPVPVRVIRLERNSGGPARPLNVGIDKARGELIATLDHDDRMLPDRLYSQAGFCERNTTIGLCTGPIETIDRRQTTPVSTICPIPPHIASAATVGGSIIRRVDAHRGVVQCGCYVRSCSTLMFRRAVWDTVGGFDERIRTCIDLAFLIRVTQLYSIGVVDAPVATFIYSGQSLFSSSQAHGLTLDELQAYSRVSRKLLDPGLCRRHSHLMSRLYADLAFSCRESGCYWSAARAYMKSIGHRISQPAVLGVIKLFPHWIVSQLDRARTA